MSLLCVEQVWFNNLQSYVSYMQNKHNRHNFYLPLQSLAHIIYHVKIYIWDVTTIDIYYADSIQICRYGRQIHLFLMLYNLLSKYQFEKLIEVPTPEANAFFPGYELLLIHIWWSNAVMAILLSYVGFHSCMLGDAPAFHGLL